MSTRAVVATTPRDLAVPPLEDELWTELNEWPLLYVWLQLLSIIEGCWLCGRLRMALSNLCALTVLGPTCVVKRALIGLGIAPPVEEHAWIIDIRLPLSVLLIVPMFKLEGGGGRERDMPTGKEGSGLIKKTPYVKRQKYRKQVIRNFMLSPMSST